MSYGVFIAYSGEDNDMADYVYRCLSRINEIIPYKAELSQEYGEDYKRRIQQALSGSNFVIALLTKNGNSSQWLNQEIGFASLLDFSDGTEIHL